MCGFYPSTRCFTHSLFSRLRANPEETLSEPHRSAFKKPKEIVLKNHLHSSDSILNPGRWNIPVAVTAIVKKTCLIPIQITATHRETCIPLDFEYDLSLLEIRKTDHLIFPLPSE